MYRPLPDAKNSLYPLRRLVDINDSQILRRRSSPGAHLLAQLEDGNTNGFDPPSRLWNSKPLPMIPGHSRGLQNKADSLREDEMLDTIPLTPLTYSSASGLSYSSATPVHSTVFQTPAGLSIDQRSLKEYENCPSGHGDRAYSTTNFVTVPSPSGATGRPKLNFLDKFTNKWPEPLPLKPTTKQGNRDYGWNISDVELEKSVDALLLENGIGLGSGVLGLEWFSRWTGFKWCLLFSVLSVLVYGIAGLSCAIGIWFRTWPKADVMYVADNDILILITLASSILVFTALVGLTGTLLSSRPILAIYALLLWPCFISMCAIGYTAYKRATFALEQKLNMSWSQYYTPYGRLLVQNTLKCCGWLNPNHGGTPSRTCYPRTPLPGCKGPLMRFEQANLQLIWSTVFSLVPMHLVNIVVVMLCANHVTTTFGSGIMPKKYRLTARDVQEDASRF